MRFAFALAVGMVACGGAAHAPENGHAAPAQPKCPEEMAQIDAYCIDRWEASLVAVPGDASFSPYEQVKGRAVRAVSRAGVVPQGYVSQLEAKAACEASGKRLCAKAEWMHACKGPGGTLYPYGPKREAGVCNGESVVSPLSFMPPGQQFPNMPNMNNPKLNQLPNTLAKTGEYARCTNGYGVFDMVGNLHEWTAEGAFHGGYYRDTAINGEGCDYETTAHENWYHDYSTGFRCCADPK